MTSGAESLLDTTMRRAHTSHSTVSWYYQAAVGTGIAQGPLVAVSSM